MDDPLPQPIFITNRLIVRHMHPQDAPSMASNADNPLVAKYMSLAFPDPYTLSDAHTWISMNLAKSSQGNQENFAICEGSSPDIVIGGIGLKPGADVEAHTAEVGFWVGEKYWGKGYVTEVLGGFTRWTMLNYKNKGVKTTKLCGKIFAGNTPSMRCFEKCGYEKEGVLRGQCEKRGQIMDLHIFGLTRGGWDEKVSNVFNNY